MSRQEIAPSDPPPSGFEPQMQSTTLQDEIQPKTESIDSTPSEIDPTHDITVTEQQIANLDTEYKQKIQVRTAEFCAGN